MNELAPLENSNAVVTGANGFIGSHLVDVLSEHGCRVHALVRKTSNLRFLQKSSKVLLHTIDLTRPDSLAPSLEQADFVFHCAGLTKAKTREEYFKINADACLPFYESCASMGKKIKAVVHLSSLASVGPKGDQGVINETSPCRPLTFYGKSKLAGEEAALKFSSSLPMIVLRPPVVYGPRESNFFTYLRAVQKGWNIKIGTVHRELSLIHAWDLVRAMVKAALHLPPKENVFFVTDGNTYSWDDVVDTLIKILGVQARTIVIPEKVLGTIASLSEFLAWFGISPALFDRQRVIDVRQSSWTASSQKFFDTFGFRPLFGLERGLRDTLDWYKKNNWL